MCFYCGATPILQVIITLRDVNDNPPVYTEYQYEEAIYEIIGPNTAFLTLYTTDEDLGLFGRVRYRKVPGVGNDTKGECYNFMLTLKSNALTFFVGKI